MTPVEKLSSYRMRCVACGVERIVPVVDAPTTRCECETAKKQMLDQAMPTLPADPPKTVTIKRLTAAELEKQRRDERKAAFARSIV
ncbi:hypothetical protein EN788_08105 [Mesorhizobium sp. M2D.F.Ca.ET.145.01.1.1]|nr:hypothetical protein EN788_08105 [Mesorhizobium sp. M2D.F.Ca.ET.145.01.1.1]